MKKTVFLKLVLFTAFTSLFTSFCFSQEDENDSTSSATTTSPVSISIDQIAQELESEEDADNGEVIIEEEVFASETENAGEEEAALVTKNENYWRGKIAVASENEFPKGIFAMAKGYLPGDTLKVINGKTQKTTNVLVIGTIDQNDAVGIKFSYEAALEIKINSQTDGNVILDERLNPPDTRETANAKLVIFGNDETDYSSFEQPVLVLEDEEILKSNNPDFIEEIAAEFEESEPENKIDEEPVEVVQKNSLIEEKTDGETDGETALLAQGDAVIESAVESETVGEGALLVERETAAESGVSPSDDSYAPIILDIPAEVEKLAEQEESLYTESASFAAEKPVEEPKQESEIVDDPMNKQPAVTIVKTEEKNSAPQPAITNVQPALSDKACEKKKNVPYKKFIANEKMIRPGYYIQLSFLTSEENLQKLVDKHNDDLKLFLIPHKNGFKVFAGVFNEDDKDYALDYVKTLGFKDAFVKKIGK